MIKQRDLADRVLDGPKRLGIGADPYTTVNVDRHKVSIIVVNWNGADFLQDCLGSLTRQSYSEREIILVDNGSTDSSVRLVREQFPSVRIVELSENRGFTGGNIEGLNVASGEFIALVNNDAVVDETWLETLIQPLLRAPTVGICASKILFDDGQRLNSAGNGLTTAGVGFDRALGESCAHYTEAEFVFGACGAAVLYRRRMIEEIGFFDERFFLYDEDTDLNFRAQLNGWKCAYVPNAVVHHKGNATARRLSDLHVYYHTRNLEWVWLKNMPAVLMVRFAHHKLIQEIGSFCYLCLRHGRWAPFFRAKGDVLKMLPILWRARKHIQSRRRVPNRYLRTLFSSIFTLSFLKRKLWQFVRG